MPQDSSMKTGKVQLLDSDDVFLMLSDRVRRQMIWSLVGGDAKLGYEINQASGKSGPAYRRDLAELCKAGILVKKENPKDRRQPLFALSPNVRVRVSENVTTVQIGRCLLRRRKSA